MPKQVCSCFLTMAGFGCLMKIQLVCTQVMAEEFYWLPSIRFAVPSFMEYQKNPVYSRFVLTSFFNFSDTSYPLLSIGVTIFHMKQSWHYFDDLLVVFYFLN